MILLCSATSFKESKGIDSIILDQLCCVFYRLSGYGGINVGLPPASPSEGDLMNTVSYICIPSLKSTIHSLVVPIVNLFC